MILLKLLDHDLHRSKKGLDAVPLWLETPAKLGFLPAIVSSSRGKFIVSRKLTKDGRLRSGVFEYDSDRIDDVIGDIMAAAYSLSCEEKWGNVFTGADAAKAGFTYVQTSAGVSSQPHICLVPESMSLEDLSSFMGDALDGGVYMKVCRVHSHKVPLPVFFSRPDFVGMYTQFVGGRSSMILHNVRNGLAFCRPGPAAVKRSKRAV